MSYGDDYTRPRNPLMQPRVLIAVAIVLFGLVKYVFFNNQVNPITGERQHVAMSTQQEISLGMQSAPQMAQQMGGILPSQNPETQLVKAMGEKLVSFIKTERNPYKFHFHLLKDPRTINAFALPGGQVFITKGLLDKLETKAQLAGVLGHEIGHVVHRHAAQHMAQSELGQSITQAVGVAASDNQGSGRNAAMIANAVNQMVQLKYGRGDELEADGFGLQLMAHAGYDPSAMLGVMKILQAATGDKRQPEFLSTHPYPENRIEAIEAYLQKHYPDGIPANLSEGGPLHRLGQR